jgi:hypothetical protein
MIRPAGFTGAAFGTKATGDLRINIAQREVVAADLEISSDWAFVHQIHSAIVVEATRSGRLGDADAIVSRVPGIPVAVATADCVPVIIEADAAVAVIHAGWRGAIAGVVPATLAALHESGHEPVRAAIGPAIGPCCYEVGDEVAEHFDRFVGRTTWGSRSVDIPRYLEDQLTGLAVWKAAECTFTSARLHSWRRDRTKQRQVAVAWLPSD